MDGMDCSGLLWQGEITLEEYIKHNTFFMTPSTLRKYLGLENNGSLGSDISQKSGESREYMEFLENLAHSLSSDSSADVVEKFLFLKEKPKYLHIMINCGLGAYELLGRLLLLLDYKYKEGNITDPRLVRMIKGILSGRREKLPNRSTDIKSLMNRNEKFKELLTFILGMMIQGKFAEYYKTKIEDNEYMASSIKELYEVPFDSLKLLSQVYVQFPELQETIAKILALMDNRESRGSSKAEEGLEYEEVLREYIEKKLGTFLKKSKKDIQFKVTIENCDQGTDLGRKWDVHICVLDPKDTSKKSLKVIFEVMYMVTTSSGQTTKFDRIEKALKKIGQDSQRTIDSVYILMDGAGWITRWSDAKKVLDLTSKAKNVPVKIFTFNKDSIACMAKDLISTLFPTES